MYQKDLQISKGTGSQAVGLTNPHAPVWQDGKSSEQRKKLVKSMKKELGLQPYGEITILKWNHSPQGGWWQAHCTWKGIPWSSMGHPASPFAETQVWI